jgi:predicted nucleic acid-binding protein
VSARFFIDTHVFVYADDAGNADKRARALGIVDHAVRSGLGVISTQVLLEFYAVATRKLAVSPELARAKVALLSRMDVVEVSPSDVLGAIDNQRLHGVSIWDGLILRCAKKAGCTRLLSEDLQQDRDYDGVRVENPFRSP